MKELVVAAITAWILLVVASHAVQAGSFEPSSVILVNEINLIYPAGGASEHTKMILDQISSNQDYAQILKKTTTKERVYGCVSPLGWKAYVSQDAISSWQGLGLAAYSLWS